MDDVGSLRRGDLLGKLTTFGSLRFPTTDIWTLLRRTTLLSELLDELIEDSPFLQKLHQEALVEGEAKGETKGRQEGEAKGCQEGEAEGRGAEARAMVRDLVRVRFAGITAEELAGIDTLADADRLHALALALASAPDEPAARRALAEALA
jgi:hypothetical protein